MKASILQIPERCFYCGRPYGLEVHHIFFGTANRKLSDEDGCWVWLCPECHRGTNGVHNNNEKNRNLKRICQQRWEIVYGNRKDFIKRYGRSYV